MFSNKCRDRCLARPFVLASTSPAQIELYTCKTATHPVYADRTLVYVGLPRFPLTSCYYHQDRQWPGSRSRFIRQNPDGPPAEFPPALPSSSLVYHLSGCIGHASGFRLFHTPIIKCQLIIYQISII